MSIKKIIFVFWLVLFCAAPFFAEAESAKITDKDVKNFAKNYSKIEKALDKYGTDMDDYASIEMIDAAVIADVEKILDKYGISGPNRIEKLYAICICYAVETYEKMLKEDPETAAMIASMGENPIAEFKANANSKDREVVRRNLKQLDKALQ